MGITSEAIESHLKPLLGIKLSAARRAADMRVLHFGRMRPKEMHPVVLKMKPDACGTIGDYSLHIQCPWRFEDSDGIITGQSDLWEPVDETKVCDWGTFDYEQGNLQDALIGNLFEGYDLDTKTHINSGNDLIVEDIQADDVGGLILIFSGDYKLAIFPSGNQGEDWRFFRPSINEPHFVIAGGMIEE